MTNQQLNEAWAKRGEPGSMVAPGWIDGKGKDSDFMTIGIDGHDAKIYERSLKSTEWREVTTAPAPAQQSKS